MALPVETRYYPPFILGIYAETYTPTPGRIKSGVLKDVNGNAVTLRWVRFVPNASGNYTVKDSRSDIDTVMTLVAGYEYFFPVSQISVGAGTVTIIHDGEIAQEIS